MKSTLSNINRAIPTSVLLEFSCYIFFWILFSMFCIYYSTIGFCWDCWEVWYQSNCFPFVAMCTYPCLLLGHFSLLLVLCGFSTRVYRCGFNFFFYPLWETLYLSTCEFVLLISSGKVSSIIMSNTSSLTFSPPGTLRRCMLNFILLSFSLTLSNSVFSSV